MNIDVLRHWIPQLKKRSKYIYVAKYCPFCNQGERSSGYIFRVNLKLKIYKCYNCGRGGKTIQKFLWCIKKLKIMGYIPDKRYPWLKGNSLLKVDDIEVQTGCITKEDSELPF